MTRWFVCGCEARATDCAVNGTNAKRSAAVPESGPEAAKRCAEGAGLDAGDARRSTMKRVVKRAALNELHLIGRSAAASRYPPIYTSLTDVTASDALGRGYYARGAVSGRGYRNGYRTGRLKSAEGLIDYSAPQTWAGAVCPIRYWW